MKKLLLSIFVLLIMLSCGEKVSVKEVKALESKVLAEVLSQQKRK